MLSIERKDLRDCKAQVHAVSDGRIARYSLQGVKFSVAAAPHESEGRSSQLAGDCPYWNRKHSRHHQEEFDMPFHCGLPRVGPPTVTTGSGPFLFLIRMAAATPPTTAA